MDDSCKAPGVSLGLLFASETGQEMYKPLVALEVPPYVRAAVRKICEKTLSAGSEAAGAAAGVASEVAGSIKEGVREETPNVLKTLGSVMMLRPEDIPPEYQGPIYGLLQSKAKNAPSDGLPEVRGADKYGVPQFITNKVAGWIGFEGDLGAVLWLDKDNRLVGAAGTIRWAIPVKSR